MTSRSSGKNQFLSAALAYAERGWPVFPLGERDKKPFANTRGFLDASTDRSQVLQWWQLFPNANIGIATGIGFDVLDIDGPASVPYLQEILGADYRHTGPVVRTSKGQHLYFAPCGARNRASLGHGKLDYRGAGGYVVAPPSIHPSGRRYDWDGPRDYHRSLPMVPEGLLGLVLKPEPKPAPRLFGILRDNVELSRAAKMAAGRPDIIETVERLGGIVLPHKEGGVTNCLFHHDPGPSMVLYIHDNSFHCFGCEAHGDSVNLLRGEDMTGRKLNP